MFDIRYSLLFAMLRFPFFAVVACCALQSAPAEESPREVLQRHGLREENGKWISAEERRLTRLLERVDERLREFHRTSAEWRKQIQRVETLEKEVTSLESQYEQVDQRRILAGSLLAKQQFQELQGRLTQRIGELRLELKRLQSEEESKLYETARQHALARGELTASVVALSAAFSRVATEYASLGNLEDVEQALAALPGPPRAAHTIGSADAYGDQVKRAEKRAAEALAGVEFPLVTRGGTALLSILVNGTPSTFAIDDKQRETLLPIAQAVRLGLFEDIPTEWQTIRYGEHELKAVPIVLPSLQVGDATLDKVRAVVTGHEHEELGARLGSDVVDRLGLKIDRDHARILVRPPSSDDTPRTR